MSTDGSSDECKEKAMKSEKIERVRVHSELKHRQSESVSNRQVRNKAREKKESKVAIEQASDESQTDSENEESDSGNDSSEDERKPSDEEYFTAFSDFEEDEEDPVLYDKKTKKKAFNQHRKVGEKSTSKAAVDPSNYDSPVPTIHETHPNIRDHDIQQKRRNKKRQRRESSMSPTAIESSSPSTSQEEKKKQPVSKKQGHRKKHVRKMKEKRERMKRRKEIAAHFSGTDDSSPECDMIKSQYEGEMKELVNIFERFFGQMCCIEFRPKDVAAELLKLGLISIDKMKHMVRSPESQQEKIISLLDLMHKKIKFHPDRLFMIIKVMLENEALQETAREILRETGMQCLVCALHIVSYSKTLLPAGRVCPVETSANFPSQLPSSDTVVTSTADTLSSAASGM